MNVKVYGYDGKTAPEKVNIGKIREVEIDDDWDAVLVTRGVFVYGDDHYTSKPEDSFGIPEVPDGGGPAAVVEYPIWCIHRQAFAAGKHCVLTTVTYLVVADVEFVLTRLIAQDDDNLGSDRPTYVEERIRSQPIIEINVSNFQ